MVLPLRQAFGHTMLQGARQPVFSFGTPRVRNVTSEVPREAPEFERSVFKKCWVNHPARQYGSSTTKKKSRLTSPETCLQRCLALVVMDAQQDSPSASADEDGPLDPKDGCTAEEEGPRDCTCRG